jgi:hypothetical protein
MSESPTIHQREDFAREAASLESLAGHNLGYGFAAALEINYYHGRADVDYFGAREALDDSRGDHPHGDAPPRLAGCRLRGLLPGARQHRTNHTNGGTMQEIEYRVQFTGATGAPRGRMMRGDGPGRRRS